MSLDLTLEENDAMDYVKGRVVEPPSSALVVAKTKYKKDEVKANKLLLILFTSLWLPIFLIWKHLRRCMISGLGCSK